MKKINKGELLKGMGKRYYEARKQKGWTQEKAAEICEVTQQTISDAEHGEFFLAPDVMLQLCLAYGISVSYLMTGQQAPEESLLADSREKLLTQDQLNHLKIINNNFFEALGITEYPEKDDSR